MFVVMMNLCRTFYAELRQSMRKTKFLLISSPLIENGIIAV